MRSAAIAIAVVVVVGLAVLLVEALTGSELDAVRPGVLAETPVAELPAGQEICERPLDLDRPVRRMGVALDAYGRPGPRLDLEVRDADDGEVLAEGTVPEGWNIPLGAVFVVTLSETVPADSAVAVCARNAGRQPAVLTGKQSIAGAALYPEQGERIAADWAIYFPLAENERRTYLGMSHDILRRASVLRPGLITPLTYVVLALALLIGGSLLLWRAIRASGD
jgi:hypothetical protein